jgi:hypothetical protein
VEDGTLGIWVSEIAKKDIPRIESLRQHERVVREALRTATPLPMRFGTSFRDEADAITVLQSRRTEFEASLDRVADRVEMGIRVSQPNRAVVPTPAAAPAGPVLSGRDYLERRREQMTEEEEAHENSERVLSDLTLELADLDAPTAQTLIGRGELVGSLAHLVHRTAVRPYRGRVARLQQQHEDLYLVVSGPWAPYSFV